MLPRRAERHRAVALGVAVLAATGVAACTATPDSDSDQPTVSVFGPWRGESAEAFRESMTTFEERTGIDVVYTGSANFVGDATRRVQDGLAADVMVFPQPGVMLELADQGLLVPLRSDVVQAATRSHRPEVTEALPAEQADVGIVYRLNVKSLVWYPPAVFDESGYSVPRTWSELDALAQQIADDGTTPWCLGVEAFTASGWAATDWIEDIVLRSAPVDTYDRWAAGDLPFTDAAIAASFEDFSEMALTVGRPLGGRRAVLNTNVQAAAQPMFDDPPGCLLHRQASFASDDLDPSVEIGPDGDIDVFVLPGRDDGAATAAGRGHLRCCRHRPAGDLGAAGVPRVAGGVGAVGATRRVHLAARLGGPRRLRQRARRPHGRAAGRRRRGALRRLRPDAPSRGNGHVLLRHAVLHRRRSARRRPRARRRAATTSESTSSPRQPRLVHPGQVLQARVPIGVGHEARPAVRRRDAPHDTSRAGGDRPRCSPIPGAEGRPRLSARPGRTPARGRRRWPPRGRTPSGRTRETRSPGSRPHREWLTM